LIVDVDWHESVNLDAGFDDVNVRIFTAEEVQLTKIDPSQGEEYLFAALCERAKES